MRQPDHAIKRTKKLDPRAQIGYLVGYSASNIYNIWTPSLNKVISARDVTFDENTLFNPDHAFPSKESGQFAELKAPELDVSDQAVILANYADTMDLNLLSDEFKISPTLHL